MYGRKAKLKRKPSDLKVTVAASEERNDSSSDSEEIVEKKPEPKIKSTSPITEERKASVISTSPSILLGQNSFTTFNDLDSESVWKSHKYQHLPIIKVRPVNMHSLIELVGPDEHAAPAYCGDFIVCKSVSTYPYRTTAKSANDITDTQIRMGDPICDIYGVSIFQNATVIALADGCNWGKNVRISAQIAAQTFLSYIKSKLPFITTLRECGHFLLRSFAHAHSRILEGPNGNNTVPHYFQPPLERKPSLRSSAPVKSTKSKWTPGTTTLLGGLLLELDEDEVQVLGCPFVFVCANVGDCKVYHYSNVTKKATDITEGSRPCAIDPQDPGGRLGPYGKTTSTKDAGPDLRNLGLYMMPCDKDSFIIVVSDGVHDNLDPQHLGLSPTDLDQDHKSWDDVDPVEVDVLKSNFKTQFIEEDIIGSITNKKSKKTTKKKKRESDESDETDESNESDESDETDETDKSAESDESDDESSEIGVDDLAERLVRHCVEITESSRIWMEENPTRRMPMDYSKFKGKMDHTTVVVFKVGNRRFDKLFVQKPAKGKSS
eukprot:TRINITY_DN4583_c0_g1_i2.p1 TRINITY_DN4583_c0_g1~~TRINITY_DN4583_c0_g1_i2.p1  ORF type:complete len:548 (-),score=101.04 TRINITY_DN4583_c0_g1_i2:179-1822(-)